MTKLGHVDLFRHSSCTGRNLDIFGDDFSGASSSVACGVNLVPYSSFSAFFLQDRRGADGYMQILRNSYLRATPLRLDIGASWRSGPRR